MHDLKTEYLFPICHLKYYFTQLWTQFPSFRSWATAYQCPISLATSDTTSSARFQRFPSAARRRAEGTAAENRLGRGIARKSGRFNQRSRMGRRGQTPRGVTTTGYVTNRVSLRWMGKGEVSSVRIINAGRPRRTGEPLRGRKVRRRMPSFRTKRGTSMGTRNRVSKGAQETAH